MHRLVTGMVALVCVLWTFSQAAAQTNAELKNEVDALKRQVAALQAQPPAKPDVKAEDTQKTSEKVIADSAQYSADFKVLWNDGVWFKAGDKFALHVGGRMLMDWVWIRAPGVERDLVNKTPLGAMNMARPQDGVEVRSIRLLAEGTLYKYVNFKLEVDFHADDELYNGYPGPLNINNQTAKGSDMVLKDAYIEMTQIPFVGSFRVGHFKEPFGLEQQTDDLFLTFMERSAGNCLVPGYNFGLMAHNAMLADSSGVNRLTWAIGLFRSETLGNAGTLGFVTLHPTEENLDGQPVRSDTGYVVTARVTGLPYYVEKGEKLVHVGVSYSYRGANDSQFARFMARPECDFFQYPMLDVSVINAKTMNVFGAEAAVVYGPFSVQSEYTGVSLDPAGPGFPAAGPFGTIAHADNTLCFNAFYVQASYFVTGEHRNYNTETGAFDRIRPKKNFRDGGWGAVEVAARYSYLDLDEESLATFSTDGGYLGSRGEYNIGTVGVNWYLNPSTKVAANYIRACPVMNVTSSAFDVFMMRFQVDF